MELETVIGLETHIQLRTRTKLFCGCSIAFGAAPNTQTCPVCLGLPGAMPVVNRLAVEKSIAAGLVLNSLINPVVRFDRKNYYYPDLPKNYQTSQFDLPVCVGGGIDIETAGGLKRIRLVRAHLEEDAGKLNHDEVNPGGDTRVDLNRAGTPLLEIVTEPDIRSPEEAVAYLLRLKKLIEYQDISDCEMAQGSLRCDVNISLRPVGQTTLNTRTEIKNLNSFNFIDKAIRAEVKRQVRLYETGEPVRQATCLYDVARDETRVMRFKEDAHDYRYFPEPDLPPIRISDEWIKEIRGRLAELPEARYERYRAAYGLSDYDAKQLTTYRAWGDYYEAMLANGCAPSDAANWFINDLIKYSSDKYLAGLNLIPAAISELIKKVADKTIQRNPARLEILPRMMEKGMTLADAAKDAGIELTSGGVSRDAIRTHLLAAMASNPKAVEQYRAGQKDNTKWFIGQIMRPTKRQASVEAIQAVINEELGEFKPQ